MPVALTSLALARGITSVMAESHSLSPLPPRDAQGRVWMRNLGIESHLEAPAHRRGCS